MIIIAENVTPVGLQPHERELGDIYACVRTVVSAAEQGWVIARGRQFVFMFHKPRIYTFLAAAGLPASVPSLENQMALQSVLRLFERLCGCTWGAYLVANETELAEELAGAMNRPGVKKRHAEGPVSHGGFHDEPGPFLYVLNIQANGKGWRNSRKLASSAWWASNIMWTSAPCIRWKES